MRKVHESDVKEAEQEYNAVVHYSKKIVKIKWEWNRKLFHSSIGFFVFLLYKLNVSQMTALKVVFPITLVYGQLDFLRFIRPEWNLHFTRWLGVGMRPAELSRLQLTSSLYYLFGACTVLLYFERTVCVLSLLMLAWGDTAAAFGGRLYKIAFPRMDDGRRKTIGGSVAAYLTGALIVYCFCGSGFKECVTGGLICAVGEYVSVFGLDDNLTMPVICAILLTVAKIK